MKKAILLLLFSVLFLGMADSSLAVGMITEPIIISDILRGGEFTETITVFNPEDTEVVYEFGTNGQINGWINFFKTEDLENSVSEISVPPKQYYDIIAQIKIPDETLNGNYTGEVFVRQKPKGQSEKDESFVAVAQMVSREVSISVTDKEIISLSASVIPASYDIEKGEPLEIKIIYDNSGNVALKPSVQLKINEITGSEGNVFNAIFPYPENLEPVKPGQRKTIPLIKWHETDRQGGKYRAQINVFAGSQLVQEKSFKFNIVNFRAKLIGETFDKFLGGVAFVGRGNLMLGWVIIGLFLAMLAVMTTSIYFIHKKRGERERALQSSRRIRHVIRRL